ncbi:hypothetical protein RFI_36825, partial [Reticulomyxa filosa]
IEEMKEHLENKCPLKHLECKFKEFGCDDILFNFNFEQHLQLQMKKHLDLLLDYITILQNKIKQSQFNEVNPIVIMLFIYLFEEIKKLKLKSKEQENETQLLKSNNDNTNSQIEALLKQKQQWDEKEKEMKKLQNDIQQESLKYRADFELLKKDYIEKEKQIIRQNYTFQNESNQLKLKIDELNCKLYEDNIEIGQLKIQIQNKDNEINILNQNIQLKDKQIIDKAKLIQQMERYFNDKQKKSQSQYEQSITLSEDKRLQLTQDFQTLSKKPIDQDKEEKYEQKQPKNQDDSLSIMSSGITHTPNFDNFRSSSKLLKNFTGHTDFVYSIDYSTFDGQFICSGSSDNTVRVWDVDNNKQIQSFNEHSAE